MTTSTTTATTGQAPAARRSAPPTSRTSFGRLIGVELRKATNTRAARTLLIASFAVSLLAMGIATIVNVGQKTPGSIPMYLQFAVFSCQILLPLVAVMLVTSEWTQRTGMVTFALEPRRAMVIFAKLAAAMIIAVVVAALIGLASMALVWITQLTSSEGALANGILDSMWRDWPVPIISNLLAQVAWVLIAFGFACLILNTPATIVFFLVVQLLFPAIFQIVGQLDGAKDIVPWFDPTAALGNLGTGRLFEYFTGPDFDAAAGWAHLVSALAVWMVLPLVLGLIRVTRAEIK